MARHCKECGSTRHDRRKCNKAQKVQKSSTYGIRTFAVTFWAADVSGSGTAKLVAAREVYVKCPEDAFLVIQTSETGRYQ